MAKLENSKRRLPQAVYSKLKLHHDGLPFRPRHPWFKLGIVAALSPTRQELAGARQSLNRELPQAPPEKQGAFQQAIDAIATLESVLFERGEVDIPRAAARMTGIDALPLVDVAGRLLEKRKDNVDRALKACARLLKAYGRPAVPEPGPIPAEAVPSNAELVQTVKPDAQGGAVYRVTETLRPAAASAAGARVPLADGGHVLERVFATRPAMAAFARPKPGASLTLEELLSWAVGTGTEPAEAQFLVALARHFSYDTRRLKASDAGAAFEQRLDHYANLAKALLAHLEIEPIGFLHLERLTFAPDGIERGELVYSVPLAPGEEVNIAHKEWSHTSEEFQKIVTDSFEDFSEEGVAEKSELSQSANSQTQHANSIGTGVTASGEYGPVSVSSSLSVSVADSAQATQQSSRNQSIAVTRTASSRSKKEHKTSFKVASAAGTEDQAVRKIRNPYPDKSTRVDYYQLIRKWEVNVFRYGIRLTYDITVPEPGSDVISRIVEIESLKAAMEEGFAAPNATLPWARFDLKPGDVKRENYTALAAEYGAAVPAPPAEFVWFDTSAQHKWATAEEAQRNEFFALEVTVEPEYAIDEVTVDRNYTYYVDYAYDFGTQGVDDFIGTSGKRILIYKAVYLGSLYVELRVRARLRDAAYAEWQLKAWNAMRDAALSRYYEQRLLLKDKVAKLSEAMEAQDALSLRKIEREEIMKGVLRWVFGPGFRFVPPGVPLDLYTQNEAVVSQATWGKVLAHGEVIKFLHQAIEWENVLYFLYPYFWSHLSRWELKKSLDHPDPLHRAFLKAGSSRVVLTIRPGFERDFVSLLETGTFNGLAATHPYMTVIEEMEAYANTNYAGIPPANPEGADAAEEGLLIGTWYEYTPTSALDIAFGETLPAS
jgi:hypothetical protein